MDNVTDETIEVILELFNMTTKIVVTKEQIIRSIELAKYQDYTPLDAFKAIFGE